MRPGWNFLRLVWLWLIYVSATKAIDLQEKESITLSCTTAKNDFVTWHIHNSEKQVIAFGSLVNPVYTETFAVKHVPERGVYNLTLFSFNSTAEYTSKGLSCRTLTRERNFWLSHIVLEPPSDVVTMSSRTGRGKVERLPDQNSTYFRITGDEYERDNIVCLIEGGTPASSIEWFHGPRHVGYQWFSRMGRSWSSDFRLIYSRSIDRTNFTCKVSHPTFDQPRIFTVEIRLKYIQSSPPILSKIQSEYRGRVAYQCISVGGRPAPRVKWRLQDKTFYRSREETSVSSTDTYTIKSSVSIKESKTTQKLSCSVGGYSVYVEVSPDIDIAFNVYPRNDKIFRGYNITLGCSAKKKTNIKWHKVKISASAMYTSSVENITHFYALPDEMVTFIDSRNKRASASVIRSPDDMKTYVTLYNVTADDSDYNYKCTFFYLAPNFTIQSVEQTLRLSVEDSISDPPTVTIDDTEITEGNKLNARCSSQLRKSVGYLDWQLTRTDGTVIHIPAFTDTTRSSRRYSRYDIYGSSSISYTVAALDNGSLLTCVLLQERQPPISSSPVKITTVIAPPTGNPDRRLCDGDMQYKNFTTCEIDQWCYGDKKPVNPQTSYSIGCADIGDCPNVSGYMNGICQACCMNNDYCSSYLC